MSDFRSSQANRKMWAMLRDVSKHVHWDIDGEMQLVSEDDWKDIFSAALSRHQRMARGIDGGLVYLGQRTSKFTTKKMADMITVIYAFGNEKGVQWSDPDTQSLIEWAESYAQKM